MYKFSLSDAANAPRTTQGNWEALCWAASRASAHTTLSKQKHADICEGKKGANSRMLARSAASACFSVCLLALPFLFLPSKDGAGKGAEGDEHPTPHPFLNNEKREKEGGKSLRAEDLTGLLKSNVSTGFNPPLAFKS